MEQKELKNNNYLYQCPVQCFNMKKICNSINRNYKECGFYKNLISEMEKKKI